MVAVRQLEQVANALLAAVGQGQKVLAVGGCRGGDGATTMLLCAARWLARHGLRTALVDGTFSDPQLATRLGLLPQNGWEDVLAGRLPLEEVVIDSTADGLSLLPVVKSQSGMDGLFERRTAMAASLDTLAEHYDVVLVDAGPLADRLAACLPLSGGSRLDAAVVVHNPRTTPADAVAQIEQGLTAAGVAQLGIVQNFIRT
jgi:Mrp family chromosome partitioning ATPase